MPIGEITELAKDGRSDADAGPGGPEAVDLDEAFGGDQLDEAEAVAIGALERIMPPPRRGSDCG